MIVFYLASALSGFLFIIFLRFFRGSFYRVARYSLDLVDKILADVDEDSKIELLQKSNKRLVAALGEMILALMGAAALAALPFLAHYFYSGYWLASGYSSLYFILALSAGASLPFFIPLPRKASGYSELSELLHHLALDNYHLAYKLFRRESRKIKREGLKRREDFVIVTGLARAGTTSFMNDLAELDDYVSLSYANMPFLTAPHYWAKIYNPQTAKLQERSHGDGIRIGLQSSEALEEYFFKVLAEDSYIEDEQLREYTLDEKAYRDYLDYQTVVKRADAKIYLAKNNNFLLRYRSVRDFNERFITVILFREPLAHAASLLEKHRDYQKLQKEDPFVLQYMNWLGHHEFGLNQKPLVFDGAEHPPEGDKNKLDFWLQSWIHYYRRVLEIDHPNTLLISYESYCEAPEKQLRKVLAKTGVNPLLTAKSAFANKREVAQPYSEELYRRAAGIFDELQSRNDDHMK